MTTTQSWTPFDKRTLRADRAGFIADRVRPMDLRLGNPRLPYWLKERRQIVMPCSRGVVEDRQHGQRVLARCGKWSCKWCGDAKRNELIAEIAAVRASRRKDCVHRFDAAAQKRCGHRQVGIAHHEGDCHAVCPAVVCTCAVGVGYCCTVHCP